MSMSSISMSLRRTLLISRCLHSSLRHHRAEELSRTLTTRIAASSAGARSTFAHPPHGHARPASQASPSQHFPRDITRTSKPASFTTTAMDSSPAAGKPALTRDLTLPNHHPPIPVPTSSTSTLPSTTTIIRTTTTPRLVYGTAWKKGRTATLVHAALRAGFRGIDTANQPRHYAEHLVGEGITLAFADGTIASRGDVFVQTKFTSPRGQDPPPAYCPYDPADPLEKQVRDSVEGSFVNLFGRGAGSGSSGGEASGGEEQPYIDSLVLHSPMDTYSDTFAVWKVLESYVPHRIRHLGIANAPPEVVERLYHETTNTGTTSGAGAAALSVPPSVVQNRFYAPTAHDRGLRRFCRARGIVYQSFWTLTANNADVRQRGKVDLVGSEPVARLAAAVAASTAVVSREVAYYSLVLGLEGVTILDGTTSEAHMREDLDGVDAVGRFAESDAGKGVWGECLAGFKALIGEDEEDEEGQEGY
ncbi:alcohol dehydrogenase (NADP+) [Microdochium nivale]|nr:alcohol dehydrogenase (NADP+) [Microdochium nivale]